MSASVRALRGSFATSPSKQEAWVDCAALFVLAFAVRFFWINKEPLWADEIFSVFWSQLDQSFILGQGAHVETNPPAYYLLLHSWIQLAGSAALAVRLPSVLFSTVTVLVTYAVGYILLDRPTARLAAVFAAVDPTTIMFAQEARPYALTGLMDGLALLALSGYAGTVASRGRRWLWLTLFVLAVIGAFLAHYTSLLFIASLFAVIGLGLLIERPFRVKETLIWAGAGMVVVVGAAKPFMVAMSLSDSANISWIKPLTPAAVRVFFMDLLTHPAIPYNVLSVSACVALVLLVTVALVPFRLNRVQLGVLVLIPAVFCLLVIGASASRPILLARVGLWLTIPLCLLLARAIVVQSARWRRIVLAGTTLLVLLSSLGHYFSSYKKEDWRGAAQLIVHEPRCNGPILIGAANGLGLVMYEPLLATRPLYAILLSQRDRQTAEFLLTQRVMSPRVLDAESIGAFVATHADTVIVTRATFLERAPASLQALMAPASFHVMLNGGLTVACL